MNNSRRRPNHDLAVVKIKEQLAKRKNKNNQTDRQNQIIIFTAFVGHTVIINANNGDGRAA